MESSPESFYYAVEGYYDKEEDHKKLVRLQTFFTVTAMGGKRKGGGELQITDLWRLNSDVMAKLVDFIPGSPEHKEWFNKIKETYKLK